MPPTPPPPSAAPLATPPPAAPSPAAPAVNQAGGLSAPTAGPQPAPFGGGATLLAADADPSPFPDPRAAPRGFDASSAAAAMTAERDVAEFASQPAPRPAVPAAAAPPDKRYDTGLWRVLGAYADTTARTVYKSVVVPVLAAGLIAGALTVALGLLVARTDIGRAVALKSIGPLVSNEAMRALALAVALSAAMAAAWSLKDYFFDGRDFLTRKLARSVPRDAKSLAAVPVPYLRFYHGMMRWAGALAFLCELGMQVLAFGLVTWGVATAFPDLRIFTNPDALTLRNALLFWVERLFAVVDGPQVFGVSLSPLAPFKPTWGFGVAIVFFKVGVIGLIVRLFRDSFTLRPVDISPAYARAMARDQPPPRPSKPSQPRRP